MQIVFLKPAGNHPVRGQLRLEREEGRVIIRKREDLENVVHLIESYYMRGVRSLRIELSEPLTVEDLERINALLYRLPGFEVSFYTPKSIVLQDVMEASLEDILEVIYESTLKLFDNVIEAVEREDALIAEAVEEAHDNVHRYAQRYRRQVFQEPRRKLKRLMEKASYVSLLENVADYLSHTAHAVARRSITGKIKWEVLRVMRMVRDLLEAAAKNVKGEEGKAYAVLRAEEFLQKEVRRLMEKATEIPDRLAKLSAEAVLIHMREILRSIHQMAIDRVKEEA